MEFGVSRFLEMFEERFGRKITTAILAIFGLAVAVYCLKVIVEGGIYAYHLVKSANLIEALKQESAASHIIIFLIQIGITFAILAAVWRWFLSRQIRKAEAGLAASEAKMVTVQKRAEEDLAEFKQRVREFEEREDRLGTRMDELKARQEKILAMKRETPR